MRAFLWILLIGVLYKEIQSANITIKVCGLECTSDKFCSDWLGGEYSCMEEKCCIAGPFPAVHANQQMEESPKVSEAAETTTFPTTSVKKSRSSTAESTKIPTTELSIEKTFPTYEESSNTSLTPTTKPVTTSETKAPTSKQTEQMTTSSNDIENSTETTVASPESTPATAKPTVIPTTNTPRTTATSTEETPTSPLSTSTEDSTIDTTHETEKTKKRRKTDDESVTTESLPLLLDSDFSVNENEHGSETKKEEEEEVVEEDKEEEKEREHKGEKATLKLPLCYACVDNNHTFCHENFGWNLMCRDRPETTNFQCCVVDEEAPGPPPENIHAYKDDELRNIPRDTNARGYSNREKKAIVDALNYNRSLIARGLYKVNGLPIPPAVGMYKMRWSKELEDGAQDYADYCFNVHSQNTSYGETLSKVHEDYIEGTGESAISRYFVEFQTYNYTPGQPYNFADGMGHGYLSAWYYVNEVGCGVRYCNDMFVHTVCHFAPGAPWPGRIMYESGPTCSKCETAAVDNGTEEPLNCEESTGLCVPK